MGSRSWRRLFCFESARLVRPISLSPLKQTKNCLMTLIKTITQDYPVAAIALLLLGFVRFEYQTTT